MRPALAVDLLSILDVDGLFFEVLRHSDYRSGLCLAVTCRSLWCKLKSPSAKKRELAIGWIKLALESPNQGSARVVHAIVKQVNDEIARLGNQSYKYWGDGNAVESLLLQELLSDARSIHYSTLLDVGVKVGDQQVLKLAASGFRWKAMQLAALDHVHVSLSPNLEYICLSRGELVVEAVEEREVWLYLTLAAEVEQKGRTCRALDELLDLIRHRGWWPDAKMLYLVLSALALVACWPGMSARKPKVYIDMFVHLVTTYAQPMPLDDFHDLWLSAIHGCCPSINMRLMGPMVSMVSQGLITLTESAFGDLMRAVLESQKPQLAVVLFAEPWLGSLATVDLVIDLADRIMSRTNNKPGRHHRELVGQTAKYLSMDSLAPVVTEAVKKGQLAKAEMITQHPRVWPSALVMAWFPGVCGSYWSYPQVAASFLENVGGADLPRLHLEHMAVAAMKKRCGLLVEKLLSWAQLNKERLVQLLWEVVKSKVTRHADIVLAVVKQFAQLPDIQQAGVLSELLVLAERMPDRNMVLSCLLCLDGGPETQCEAQRYLRHVDACTLAKMLKGVIQLNNSCQAFAVALLRLWRYLIGSDSSDEACQVLRHIINKRRGCIWVTFMDCLGPANEGLLNGLVDGAVNKMADADLELLRVWLTPWSVVVGTPSAGDGGEVKIKCVCKREHCRSAVSV